MTHDRAAFMRFNAGTNRAKDAYAAEPITTPSVPCRGCNGFAYNFGHPWCAECRAERHEEDARAAIPRPETDRRPYVPETDQPEETSDGDV